MVYQCHLCFSGAIRGILRGIGHAMQDFPRQTMWACSLLLLSMPCSRRQVSGVATLLLAVDLCLHHVCLQNRGSVCLVCVCICVSCPTRPAWLLQGQSGLVVKHRRWRQWATKCCEVLQAGRSCCRVSDLYALQQPRCPAAASECFLFGSVTLLGLRRH